MPSNWYSYIDSIWANIVITDGNVIDGRIEGATLTNYFVWVPRYQYMLDQVNQKANVKFIQGTSNKTDAGYEIPDAFTWVNEAGESIELPGYWESKFQLSN